MSTWKRTLGFLALLLAVLAPVAQAGAADLKIAIMQAQAGDARKYQALLEYLSARGVQAAFVTAPDALAASEMFASG